MCSRLQRSLPRRLLDTLLQRCLLLTTQPTRNLSLSSLILLIKLFKQLAAQHIRQSQHAAADCGTITSILALAARLGDLLGEIPELSFGEEGTGCRIAGGSPGGTKLDPRRNLGVFGFDDVDELVFLEAKIRVFEGFLVDGLEIGEVALMVESFTKLGSRLAKAY